MMHLLHAFGRVPVVNPAPFVGIGAKILLGATAVRPSVDRAAAGPSRRPNLFLIGAMKSGTTYLNRLLGAHPEIFMCSPEEPTYFVQPDQLRELWPKMWDLGLWRDQQHYLALFDGAGAAKFLGEASAGYTKWPVVTGVPDRIASFSPDARFIYLVRDPVLRTISHYWHMVRFHAECRPMLDAIKRDPHYLETSYYALQLRQYLDRFGYGRVLVLSFEELTAAPVATMQSVFAWLGLDPLAASTTDFAVPENVTPEVVRMAKGLGLVRRLQQARLVRQAVPLLPASLRRFGLRLSTRPVARREDRGVADVIRSLQPIQARQTAELSEMVGRSFPEWTTLNGRAVSDAEQSA